ncbi:hypothetical protein BaRGS_00019074 [Batillaria attramentaria]|uniref:Uncharacterized protein n=1 Tax=Batillaria attramentaria TaxID=370345 RepID=A0ABD0KR72_9CAEN
MTDHMFMQWNISAIQHAMGRFTGEVNSYNLTKCHDNEHRLASTSADSERSDPSISTLQDALLALRPSPAHHHPAGICDIPKTQHW